MLHRLLLIALGVVLIPISAYAGIYGILTGTVVDSKGQPVIGATVLVEGTKRGAYTKPNGKFTIVKLLSGSYTVRVKSIGFQDYTTKVNISADQTEDIKVSLKQDAKLTDTVTVFANRQLVNPEIIGSVRGASAAEITSIPTESIAGVVAKQAGVLSGGNGFNVRGARTTETQFRIDGLDMNDQFSGAFGSTPTGYFPTVSNQATEEVQVLTGGFSAEYGNALGGIVNSVTKTGRTDTYEGFLRFKTDVGALYGKASNGLKLESQGDNIVELGGGGPIPLIDGATFYISGKYQHQKNRSAGLAVIDPWGNNLGDMPNNGLWVQNLTGRFKANVTDHIRMELGGTRGVSRWESSSWSWLYLNNFGVKGDGTVNSIEERRAKQPVQNQLIDQYYVRANHDLSQTSFYEVTLSWNRNRSEVSKRYLDATMSEFEDPGFLMPFKVWEPRDEGFPDANGKLLSAGDKALDQYWFTRENRATVDGLTQKSVLVRNPLTGYYEGGEDYTSPQNPYALLGNEFFVGGGNDRSFEFRQSTYLQFDGNYNNVIEGEEFKHYFKAGFEAKIYSLSRHQNSLPWQGGSSSFFDVYTDEWGGNFYAEENDIRELTSQPYEPFEGALYVQDQIKYKGIIITPGLRVDMVDARAQYRANIDQQFVSIKDKIATPEEFTDSPVKIRVSPRLSVAYPITDRSNFSLSYGVFFQRPPFNNFFDGVNTNLLRGNQILGDPNLEPQTVKSYQINYSHQLSDDFALDVTAYFRDMYNLAGLAYVVPSAGTSANPYTVYKTNDYGNARGVEFTLRKQATDNIGLNFTYALSRARGTSTSAETQYRLVVLSGTDEFTGQKAAFPASEYFLAFDRTHRFNVLVDFIWRDNEGPTVGGLKLLEHTHINFTAFYQTGTPFTLLGIKGGQVGEYLGNRQPSSWRIDSRIERDIPLSDLFGESMGHTTLTLFADIFNVLNRTEPVAYYARGGNPDVDGNVLARQIGDFSGTRWYKEGDASNPASSNSTQYDNFGQRLYNASVDFNKDGVVTQEERFHAYQNFVSDVIARQNNYQNPRSVSFGLMLKF